MKASGQLIETKLSRLWDVNRTVYLSGFFGLLKRVTGVCRVYTDFIGFKTEPLSYSDLG
jgi:hypothetical protein